MGRKSLVVLAAVVALVSGALAAAEPTTRPTAAPAAQARPTGRPWLGVSVLSVNDKLCRDVADSMGYLDDIGLLVQGVVPESPSVGKLEPGDILVEADGVKLVDVGTLLKQVATAGPGSEMTLSIVRQQNLQTVKLTVGIAPPPAAMPKAFSR